MCLPGTLTNGSIQTGEDREGGEKNISQRNSGRNRECSAGRSLRGAQVFSKAPRIWGLSKGVTVCFQPPRGLWALVSSVPGPERDPRTQ